MWSCYMYVFFFIALLCYVLFLKQTPNAVFTDFKRAKSGKVYQVYQKARGHSFQNKSLLSA